MRDKALIAFKEWLDAEVEAGTPHLMILGQASAAMQEWFSG